MLQGAVDGSGDPVSYSARWLSDFVKRFGWTGPHPWHWQDEKLLHMSRSALWECWQAMLQRPWQDLPHNPRLADSNSVKLATYNSWFAISDAPEVDAGDAGVMFPAGMPGHVQRTSGIPMDWLIQLVRLRTGGHHLAIETGRWSDPPKPRAQRLCRMCAQNVVEDEMHFMFECMAYDGRTV